MEFVCSQLSLAVHISSHSAQKHTFTSKYEACDMVRMGTLNITTYKWENKDLLKSQMCTCSQLGLTLVLHMKVTQQKQRQILWNNSAGIEGITQFTLRSLLHVMANLAWGVKAANESSVFGSIRVTKPWKKNNKPWNNKATCKPPSRLERSPVCSCYSPFKRKQKKQAWHFEGIKRYASNQTKSTPMFDFLCHSLDQARARCD